MKPVNELTPEEAQLETAAIVKYLESKPSISDELKNKIARFKELNNYLNDVLRNFQNDVAPIINDLKESVEKGS